MARDTMRIGITTLVTLALVVTGPLVARADATDKAVVEPAGGFVGEAIASQVPADWDGHEKVLETYCRTNRDTGYYLIVYNIQITDIQICYEVGIDVTQGDTDLYMYYQEPWNDATIPPDSGAGTQICSSTASGSADEYCNGCSLGWCIWPISGVWRNYAYVYAGPSDFCMTAESFLCSSVDVAEARARRDGSVMAISWEVTQETEVAGYHLLRRLSPDEPWTRVNPRLIPVAVGSSYRYTDQLPEGVGDVEYRIQAVALDGATDNLVRIIDRDPAGPAPVLAE